MMDFECEDIVVALQEKQVHNNHKIAKHTMSCSRPGFVILCHSCVGKLDRKIIHSHEINVGVADLGLGLVMV